jgi:hypothetical protein
MKLLRLISANLDKIDRQSDCLYLSDTGRGGLNCSENEHQLFIKHGLVRREILYNVFIEFGIPMKQVWLTKMCLKQKL